MRLGISRPVAILYSGIRRDTGSLPDLSGVTLMHKPEDATDSPSPKNTADTPSAHRPARAVALDALRGLAVLMMVFSGIIPFDKPLPRWMYHAQEPPIWNGTEISHVFNPRLPGMTWVDLVFPLFLFALGAAIPLALAGRLQKGMSVWQTVGAMGQRLALLGWFAIYLQHIRPYTMRGNPDVTTWAVSLLGFALLFPMFTRLPSGWRPGFHWATRFLGFGGGVGLLFWLSARQYPAGGGFRLDRSDIILIVLANMACFGTGVWLATRRSLVARFGVLALLFALRLASGTDGWVHTLWDYSPVPWLFEWDYLKYLFIVVPGTVAGDLIAEWARARAEEEPRPLDGAWRARLIAYVAVAVSLTAVTLAGLEGRHLVPTTLAALGLGAGCVALTLRPLDATGRLLAALSRWGLYWLALGLVAEPFEGGIRKDPSTMSYYFVSSALALFLLASLTIVADGFGKRVWLRLLEGVGQNPMLAYVAMANFLWPLFAFAYPLYERTGWQIALDRAFPTPWLGVGAAALETLLLAVLVAVLTRRRLFWRT